MSDSERRQKNAAVSSGDEDDEGDDAASDQQSQTDQIIQTGAITATKGKYVIHCLTIVGQVVIVDNYTISTLLWKNASLSAVLLCICREVAPKCFLYRFLRKHLLNKLNEFTCKDILIVYFIKGKVNYGFCVIIVD